ncbi:hypothetical protein [Bdellovibrio sp. NC01]|uniref:hypothetical protein n=1 Tax=Bdellovibrio sp. NC01 TaxID=2220073 RepID=UPI001159F53B|nr:hypothetical protein [Bdellovibrio sp. NC01]QDK36683.1 hypothetical protein DOE51_03235 [Bdellovibrio sp. NC01]
MKLIFALAATLIAFSAHAEDRKIGNVIAVERQVPNMYDTCVKNVTGDTSKEQSFYFCAINFLKSPLETSSSKGGVIRYKEANCRVDGEVANGVLLITFGRESGNTDYATAKGCLQRALNQPNNMSFVVYTIE